MMRNVVDVMRLPTTTDEAGGLIGQPSAVRRGVPCSIRTLTGREAEQVHSVWNSATHIVEFYSDPLRKVTENDYLTGGTLKDRKIYIVDIQDPDGKQLMLTLVCEEAK